MKKNCIKIIKKAEDKKSLLLAETLEDVPTLRLRKSRKPPWKTAKDLIRSKYETSRC